MTCVQCYKCGRFIGKDGYIDYDSETHELGYSMCKRCLDTENHTNEVK